MIEELTPEQTAKFDEYRDKWLEIGLSTNEVDQEPSLDAIKEIYKQSNMEFPDKIEVYNSPFEAITQLKEKYDQDVSVNDFIYGAHDAAWLSFYDYFMEVVGVENCDQLTPFINLAAHCGWALLFDEMVVLTHNPSKIKFDAEKRLHCEDGYAIEYRDGVGIAVWHGTEIPAEWIFDKESITPEVMFEWDNVEQRRAACEIVGWATVIKKLEAEIIDKDEDATVGTLYEVELPGSGKEKFLVALDPNTQKEVGLPVPQDMETALQANSWTYGIETTEFKPAFRV